MERRSFMKFATCALMGLLNLLLAVPAVFYLIDPRNRAAKPSSFKRVGKLSELEVNEPQQRIVSDTQRDAWTLHPNEVVGQVWLVRRDETTVDAYTSICSHLGCSINFEETKKEFICPCHNGTWHLSGERVADDEKGHTNPVPRAMDSLEINLVPVEDDDTDQYIEVKYEHFRQGLHEKVVKS